MGISEAEQRLRAVVADGLDRLNAAKGGRYLAEVSRRVRVERSTVSRWRSATSTARPDHCEALAALWPEFFDTTQLADLHYKSLQFHSHSGTLTIGAEVLTTAEAVFKYAADALSQDPAEETDRVIRHVAFHIERNGRDPATQDPLFESTNAQQELLRFREAETARAREGWRIEVVISAGRPERLESINNMVHGIDGPNVDMYAYPYSLPLVIAPLVVANRDVILSYDHRRWERPGAAITLRSRRIVDWANHHFAQLIADAPYHLRSPTGVNETELDRYQETLQRGLGRA